jgi:serine phosphatase RsbU (regulator of sigma subunit)
VVDATLGPGSQVAGLMGCPPFVAATFASPRRTAIVAALSTVATAVISDGDSLSTLVVRVAFVVLAGSAAVIAAHVREGHARELVTMERIAVIAQLAVLRDLPTEIGPATVAVRYVSAAIGARIGGDFYEAVAVPGGMRAVVGDVRGNGLAAVQTAGALVGAFRGADHDHLSLVQLVKALEMTFQRMRPSEEDFATVVLVELSADGSIEILSCGHPAPCLVGGTTDRPTVRRLDPPHPRPPIGFDPSPSPTLDCLRAGERLLLFTDGMTDVRDRDGVWFDLDRAARAAAGLGPEEGVECLKEALRRFNHDEITDDVTLLLIELTEAPVRLV